MSPFVRFEGEVKKKEKPDWNSHVRSLYVLNGVPLFYHIHISKFFPKI